MAGETDWCLRHDQIQCRHVTFGLGQMADSARNRHCRMHRLASDFVRMAGRTLGIFREDAGMLDGGDLRGGEQYQHKKGDRHAGVVFHYNWRCTRARVCRGQKAKAIVFL